jgi:hypothetical protein
MFERACGLRGQVRSALKKVIASAAHPRLFATGARERMTQGCANGKGCGAKGKRIRLERGMQRVLHPPHLSSRAVDGVSRHLMRLTRKMAGRVGDAVREVSSRSTGACQRPSDGG